jgi:putative membrane protein
MIWIKALHIIFLVTWFAGLFYLPRLFVYHADCKDETGHQRFLVMERKLFAIMTIGAMLTAVFGTWLLIAYAWDAYAQSGWLVTKLVLVGLLIAIRTERLAGNQTGAGGPADRLSCILPAHHARLSRRH